MYFWRFVHEAPLLALSGTKYDTKPPPKVCENFRNAKWMNMWPQNRLHRSPTSCFFLWFSNDFGVTVMGHSRKHPYLPHGGNWKLTPLPPLDVLIHLLLSETIFSPLPLRTAEISSVGGVWIFSGTTQFVMWQHAKKFSKQGSLFILG